MQKFLICGLGNIGAEYEFTRHNIGFEVADAFAAKHKAVFQPGRYASVAQFSLKGRPITIIKPTTYMNLSGKAVKYWLDHEKIPLEQLLVVVDELALPLDKIRLRPGGSAAGHNGLTNIQETLGTEQYPRLRFGIGNQYPRGGQVDFVLGRWTTEEEPLVKLKVSRCVDLVESFIFQGIAKTMSEWNKIVFAL